MEKNKYIIIGFIQDMTETLHFQNNGKDLYKKVLTVKTEDNQVIYPEIRNSNLKLLDIENIQKGDKVQIFYTFEGSEIPGKKFNNVHVHAIRKL